MKVVHHGGGGTSWVQRHWRQGSGWDIVKAGDMEIEHQDGYRIMKYLNICTLGLLFLLPGPHAL